MKTLPEEPTREMWAAMGDALQKYELLVHHDVISEAVYRAALEAAPEVSLMRAETRPEAEIKMLRTALNECADRLEKCAIHAGSDPEFAAIAVEKYQTLLASPYRAKEKEMKEWTGTLSRKDAIRLLDRMTDKDDPFWEGVVEDYYDEETDTMPTFDQVMDALGVSKVERKAAVFNKGGHKMKKYPGLRKWKRQKEWCCHNCSEVVLIGDRCRKCGKTETDNA